MNSATGSASLTVNAASPTQLVITSSAFAIIAGQCSANITVTSQDQYGNASNVSSATQLNLSSASGTGKFYSDSSCQTQIPVSNGKVSVNMAANSSTQTFAYADTTPSPLPDSTTTITAADDATVLTSGSQAETILQLVFTTPSFTVTQNTCSAQITLTAKNAKGTATNVTVAATLGLTSTSNGATFYSDNTCAMAITPTGAPLASDVTLGSGASAVNFSYEDSAAGNPTITAAIGGYSVAQQEQIGTPPSVTSNPSGQAVTYGSNAMFTAAASGTPTPTVQWQVSPDGTNWNNVGDGGVYSGATTTTLTLTLPPVSLGGNQYRAVFTNAVGSANSNAASLTVNPEPLMVSIIGDPTKTYDATTTATLTSANFSISGLVGTDKFTVTQNTGTYASANAGSGITVTASLSASNFTPYGSTVANNYSFPASASGTGTISRKSVMASITASDKNYDGTDAATITSCTIPSKVGNDDVACSVPAGNATFASSSANSTAQTVTATGITLTGTAAGNYTLSSTTSTTTAKINTAALIITASSGMMMFGGAPPMISAMYSGFVNGETPANLTAQPVCGTNATSASPVGSYMSSCSGAVDTNYTISYVPGVVTVTAASTMTAASSSENPSSYGQSVSFMATVTNTATGAAPTGSVQFVVDGSNFGLPVALTPSSNTGMAASGATTTLMAGSHTVTANYMNADGNFTNSIGTLSGGQTVNPATTSTALSSATNPSVLGQAVGFTATVTDTSSNDSAVPMGGTVSFYDGTLLIGSAKLNAGSATFTTALLSSSPHSISASFNGDANFSASMTSSAVSQAVNARSSNTAVSLSPNTVVVGQASTLTVTVTDAATTGPSGLPGEFALTANSLNTPRTGQAAALLPNGAVLVVGGQNSGGVLSSGEIYDPSAGAFTPTTSSLNTMRTGATATLLNNGTILVVGGSSDGTAAGALSSAEIFDPIAGTFTALTGTGQSITVARFSHTATLLPNGKVVFVGGQNSSGALSTMEVYDPSSQTFTAIGDTLSVARTGHAATLLMNGTILFTGGSGLASAEIYDPVAHTSTPLTASMTTDRTNHAAVLLPDGNVLVAGGMSAGSAVKSTELYNSAAGTFAATGNMQKLRSGLTATILDSGLVLVAGGSNSTYPAVASAELYTPSFDPLGTAAVSSSDITDNITGACVLTLTGTGATTCQLADAPSEVGTNPHTIAVTYSPASDQVHSSSNNSSQSDGNNNLTVNKADTSTTVASSVNPSTYGQTVTFTATVGAVSPGSGTPTGTVQFEDNGSPIGSPITLSGTMASFTVTATQFTASGHSITAVYSGDANFNATGADAGSTATALAQTVQKATPVFSNLTASQTISYGTPSISLAGTISAPCGMGCTVYPPTTEMVSITVNGITVTPAIGSNGSFSATFNTSTIPASTTFYAITYSYNTSYADTNFKSATDGSTTLTVQKATPVFSSLTASQTTTYGAPSISLAGTISAPCSIGCTVYPPNTETVLITINGVTIAPAIGSNGAFSAIFSTNTIPASATPYVITYSYNTNYADTNFKSATDASTTLTVNTRPITATLTAQNKTYDGTVSEPNANMSCSLTGVLPGDAVACTATSGTFDGSNVGAHTVTATVTISGAAAGNYTLGAAGTNVASTSAMASASITTKAITATLTAQNKTYDGTASEPNANMSCSLTGVLPGDAVACTATSGTFDGSNVGAHTVTATVTISGAAAGNYTLGAAGTNVASTSAMASASITTKAITAMLTAQNKTYDGTTAEPNANMSCSLTGVLSGDTVTCAATSGAFNTSQVATANQVTATVSLSGAAFGDYTLGASGTTISSTTAMAPANITVATPLVTVSGGPFAYDGNPHSATEVALGVSSYVVPGAFIVTYNGVSAIPLNAGTYVVSAGFTSSDSNYGSSIGIGSITINPATTSTAVSSSPNPSNWGNVVTLTATVANTSTVAAPTGSVSFYNAASGATCSSLGTSALLDTVQLTTIGTSQQASTSTPNLPVGPGNTVGTDAILACYNYNSADPNFNANFVASNGTTTQTVNPAPIATLVPSSLSFGGQQGGTTSGAQTVTICNGPSGISGSPCFNAPISTAALVISNIGFTSPNTNPVYFNQTSTCPIGGTGVPVGGSCASNVKFAPPLNAQGIATAFLTVTDNNENVAGSTQSASLVGAGTSAVTGVGSLSTYAIFGTANGCSSVNVSGNGTVDSFGNSNNIGNVGTNGNVTLSGNPVVNGAVYSPVGGTGNCSTKTMTGLSTSGKAQATGGLQALPGSINYPLPPAPNPAPPTTSQNISGSCGSISGCSNNGSKNVTLPPGQYGNLSISGGTTVNVSGGSYNINSLTLSGNSTLVVTPTTGAVIVNLGGKSLSGGNAALDVSGGSMSNPSGMASNLQFYYAGSQPMKLSGGTGSYAVVYAPNAPINISGGSHFYGSIIGSTVNSSGNTAIDYPTSLTSIGPGNSIWFSSTGLSVKGLPNTGTVKLYVTNASINFMAGGTTYNVPVPNAVITFSSTATSASTTWDATNNRWSTLVPMSSVNGNATIDSFFDGVAFQVPTGGFPTGIQNVTWQAAYSTSTTGLSFNWQWGAAVYSTLPATGATGNYSSFGVNSLDNSVPAGTPVNYEGNLVFGDTGAGYTGLSANFVGVVPTIAPMNIAPSSYDFGSVSQGSTATASMPFVLTNNDSVPYTISSIQMTGTYAGDFVQTNNCPISPNTLGAGGSCTFTVTFMPSTSGGTKETAKIVINDNANNSPQTVFLKGTGQ